jgi:hypothetical protein
MSDQVSETSVVDIPQETMLLRLDQSEELRNFTIQMWLQNPQLARQTGARVRELLLPLQVLSLPSHKNSP